MSCCGGKRAEQKAAASRDNRTGRSRQVSAQAQGPAPPPKPAAAQNQTTIQPNSAATSPTIVLHYLQSAPILAIGSATGHRYEFSVTRPIQPVDARDAALLLSTRLFERRESHLV
jgi:hypothetical protein